MTDEQATMIVEAIASLKYVFMVGLSGICGCLLSIAFSIVLFLFQSNDNKHDRRTGGDDC